MNTPLSWIKAYVPELEVGDHEYCDAMTLSGTKVEGFTRLDKNLEKIVVGHIESIERHPDADKVKTIIIISILTYRYTACNSTIPLGCLVLLRHKGDVAL